jgi:hypothetical protein
MRRSTTRYGFNRCTPTKPIAVTANSAHGCPPNAPYDRFLATCALRRIPSTWLAQTRPGARIVAPLATGLITLDVQDANHATGRFLAEGYFMPLESTHDGTFLVTEIGSRALWGEVEQLHHLWHECRQPRRERFGLSIAQERQWVWLDSPEGPHTWELSP